MDLTTRVDAYAAATAAILDAARDADPAALDRHVEGGWSARQVLHHLADSETQSYLRLRRLLAEGPGTAIQGYDEAAWAECDALGYRDLPVEHAVAVLAAVRAATLDVLRRLTPGDLERTGVHTESGRYTLDDWLDIYSRHPLAHREQLLEALSA
jgi:hypothetical protein